MSALKAAIRWSVSALVARLCSSRPVKPFVTVVTAEAKIVDSLVFSSVSFFLAACR